MTGPGLSSEAHDAAAAAALAGLPKMTVSRLRDLLADTPATEAWAAVVAAQGSAEGVPAAGRRSSGEGRRAEASTAALIRHWSSAARRVDLAAVWNDHRGAGVTIHRLGRGDYPSVLASDHQAPAVLFSRGHLDALVRPRVGIVGTRSATHYGQDVAAQLGRELAGSGIAVLSGLAQGIDAAAHEGALAAASAPPVGVVASGLDVVYPRRHTRLWDRIVTTGALLSEAPVGTPPHAWRFPLRNRIIAALSQVVVVVECHRAGGALHTVEAAAERGVSVLAVPGSVRSPASAGTNALLADGCQPARDVDDVLAALNLSAVRPAGSRAIGPALGMGEDERAVLSALDWQPTCTDEVMRRTGFALEHVAAVLDRLGEAGVAGGRDGWWERASRQ